MKYLETKDIRLEDIELNPYLLRTTTSGKDLARLKSSISKHGLISPVVVRPNQNGRPYILMAGERRFLAHQELEMQAIRAEVWEPTKKEEANPELLQRSTEIITMASNLVIEPLQLVEIGARCKRWMEDFGMTPEEVADVLDFDLETIRDAVQIMAITPEALKLFMDHPDKALRGHLLALAEEAPKTPPELQVKLVEWIVSQDKDKLLAQLPGAVHKVARSARRQIKKAQKAVSAPGHTESYKRRKLFSSVEAAEDALNEFRGVGAPSSISFVDMESLSERCKALGSGWPAAFEQVRKAVQGELSKEIPIGEKTPDVA